MMCDIVFRSPNLANSVFSAKAREEEYLKRAQEQMKYCIDVILPDVYDYAQTYISIKEGNKVTLDDMIDSVTKYLTKNKIETLREFIPYCLKIMNITYIKENGVKYYNNISIKT